MILFVSCGSPTLDQKDITEAKKLELEIQKLKQDLERNSIWAVFNQPLVCTVLTLGIGGAVFGILSDRRARKNKRLDEYFAMINNVAADLASVFTPFYQFIRHPSHQPGAGSKHTEEKELRAILATLQERMPRIFERRLSLYVTAETLLPSEGKEIANNYLEICRDLQAIARQLENFSVTGAFDKDRIPASVEGGTLPNKNLIVLQPPFEQFDRWIEAIWLRADKLLTVTINNPSLSGTAQSFGRLSRRKKQRLL